MMMIPFRQSLHKSMRSTGSFRISLAARYHTLVDGQHPIIDMTPVSPVAKNNENNQNAKQRSNQNQCVSVTEIYRKMRAKGRTQLKLGASEQNDVRIICQAQISLNP